MKELPSKEDLERERDAGKQYLTRNLPLIPRKGVLKSETDRQYLKYKHYTKH